MKNNAAALQTMHDLFDDRGTLAYGEAVNQIEHALQCGTLAEQDGASPALTLAACLHDIGHMLHRDAAAAVAQGNDDAHEVMGAKYLARVFGPEVSEPVRLHVAAKRYLCAREAGYLEQLSPLSRRTLEIQGGPMSADEASAFESEYHAQDAVRLRCWDDLSKQPGMVTLPFQHFMQLAASLVRPEA